jgi:Peptidase family M23
LYNARRIMTTTSFVLLPANEPLKIVWPTPNQFLRTAPAKFFARTCANPDYGRPGFTRDCGKRFHRGCDIAPVDVTPTGQITRVIFTDCATSKDYESDEPTFVPHDPVFCVYDGVVSELVDDESASDFGKHIIIEHRWPVSGEKFFTLYGHLAGILVGADCIRDRSRLKTAPTKTAQPIGQMGQTSRLADARNWMRIAPHLHFEVRNAAGEPYDPVEFLSRYHKNAGR